MSPTARRTVPGDLMLHPVVVASVVLLLANDHVFKLRWPSVVTGKLSDVAGLAFFPVLLFSFAEMWSAVLRRRAPSPSILVGCIFVTGIVFASAEVAPSFERVLEAMWGALASPREAISGSSSPVTMVADPSDLVALPALWVAWRVAARRRLPSESAEGLQSDRSVAGLGRHVGQRESLSSAS